MGDDDSLRVGFTIARRIQCMDGRRGAYGQTFEKLREKMLKVKVTIGAIQTGDWGPA